MFVARPDHVDDSIGAPLAQPYSTDGVTEEANQLPEDKMVNNTEAREASELAPHIDSSRESVSLIEKVLEAEEAVI